MLNSIGVPPVWQMRIEVIICFVLVLLLAGFCVRTKKLPWQVLWIALAGILTFVASVRIGGWRELTKPRPPKE